MSVLLEKVAAAASQAVVAAGCELANVVYVPGKQYSTLRVFVDRPDGGPTVADCTVISRQLGDFLELHAIMPGGYRLEVSSPGLNRHLKTHDPQLSRVNFKRFAGKLAVLRVSWPLVSDTDVQGMVGAEEHKRRKVFKGRLQGMEADDVLIQVEGALLRVPLDWISKAHLEFEF